MDTKLVNRTAAKSGCVMLDRVRKKFKKSEIMPTKYKKLLGQRKEATHTAGVASHDLLRIMFKDVPLLLG